jgi:hypothetical protein
MAAEDKTSRPDQIYMTIGHPATGPSPPGWGAVDLRLPLTHAGPRLRRRLGPA